MVAGRSIGSWLLAFTFAATYFSSVVIIVGGGWGFSHGLSTLLIAAGNIVLGTVAVFLWLGPRIHELSLEFKALSVSELVGAMHGSNSLRMLTAIMTAGGLWLYMVVIDIAVASMLSAVLGLEAMTASLIFGLVVAAYIALGGMYSVVWTDALQGTIMTVGIAVLLAAIASKVGGLAAGLEKLAANYPELASMPGRNISWGELLDLVLMTSIAVWGLPQMVNRFYTARDRVVIRRGLLFATALATMVTFSAYLSGALGNIVGAEENLGLDPSRDLARVIPVLASKVMPPSLLGLFTAAVLAASMSTIDSVAITSSTSILYDLASVRRPLLLRIGSAIYMLTASMLAIPIASLGLTKIFKAGWMIVAGALLVPIITGIMGVRDSSAALAASLAGSLSALVLSVDSFYGYRVGFIFPLSQISAALTFTVIIALHRGKAETAEKPFPN